MKKVYIILSALAVVFGMASCNDELELRNPNNQTTYEFGDSESELQEAVISCYNRIRLEGTFARVGYTMDAVRGDELWNASQVWYLPYDNLNVVNTDEIGCQWIWRDCYHVVNRCNFVLKKVEECTLSTQKYNEIKGQALFLRALAYYTIATYYQTAPLFNDYDQYSSMETMYASCVSQDELFNQIDADLVEAMAILPSRDQGGEWAGGRATCGAAAGYYARSLMFRHKFDEALVVLNDIIDKKYGTYRLMDDYGDNFREGAAYENNAESLFEIQYLDYGMGGVDEEWTPVNISSNATQGHAVESNYAPTAFGSWADLSVSPWLYNLFKAERCEDGRLDPRLYWTVASYEPEYDNYTDGRTNIIYQTPVTETPITNGTNGGFSSAKWTYARQDVCNTIVTGLHCGINLRMMRYSDVLLRAAECINEISGPTQQAIDHINTVRNRAGLADLKLADFANADELFEQIANVERPKEFGCENGRGIDLIRWGFFHDSKRLEQLKRHGAYNRDGVANTHLLMWQSEADKLEAVEVKTYNDMLAYEAAETTIVEITADCDAAGNAIEYNEKGEQVDEDQKLTYAEGTRYVVYADGTFELLDNFIADDSSFNYYQPGHEYFPIFQGTLNANQSLGAGNSANTNTDNSATFAGPSHSFVTEYVHPLW